MNPHRPFPAWSVAPADAVWAEIERRRYARLVMLSEMVRQRRLSREHAEAVADILAAHLADPLPDRNTERPMPKRWSLRARFLLVVKLAIAAWATLCIAAGFLFGVAVRGL